MIINQLQEGDIGPKLKSGHSLLEASCTGRKAQPKMPEDGDTKSAKRAFEFRATDVQCDRKTMSASFK